MTWQLTCNVLNAECRKSKTRTVIQEGLKAHETQSQEWQNKCRKRSNHLICFLWKIAAFPKSTTSCRRKRLRRRYCRQISSTLFMTIGHLGSDEIWALPAISFDDNRLPDICELNKMIIHENFTLYPLTIGALGALLETNKAHRSTIAKI